MKRGKWEETLSPWKACAALSCPWTVPARDRFTEGPWSRPEGQIGLVWEGSFTSAHSYSVANRHIVLNLARMAEGLEIALRPRGDWGSGCLSPTSAEARILRSLMDNELAAVDVHVRHFWPPDLRRPPRGRFVLIQPWEYSCLPTEWVGPLNHDVDEVWVPSRFVRQTFVSSGCPAEKVHVVPFGVDPARFSPHAPPAALPTGKGYRFLFVGGAATARKGFDVLLAAYTEEFTDGDDVCLVVKDYFYGSVAPSIDQVRARPHCPEILYVYGQDPPERIPGYYTACQCYVHPFRGEGFGLTIAEAMASGLPVIVTGYGPALDYCDESCAILLRYSMKQGEHKSVGSIPTVDYPQWPEPDNAHLRQAMRRLYQDRDLGVRMGLAGSRHARSNLTWARSAKDTLARLRAFATLLT